MKYPFENATVWDLIRHPFDEESGDPDGRTYMRLLSNIFSLSMFFSRYGSLFKSLWISAWIPVIPFPM